jgi:capsular polysaccharide biosynthesis protein
LKVPEIDTQDADLYEAVRRGLPTEEHIQQITDKTYLYRQAHNMRVLLGDQKVYRILGAYGQMIFHRLLKQIKERIDYLTELEEYELD